MTADVTLSDHELNNPPGLHSLNLRAKFFSRLSESPLQTSQKLIFFPLGE